MKSTPEEVAAADNLARETRARIIELIEQGKKVHIIWDFDGVLADSRSDDIFALISFNLQKYFAYEERLLFECPGSGKWLLPIAHNCGAYPHFPSDKFSQDIVTARSSTLALRVHFFCLSYHLPIRWMLFLGHQSKRDSYRIILESLKKDPDYVIFCVDDGAKHIAAFQEISKELGMEDRTFGIVSPVVREYTEAELQEHLSKVMNAKGDDPLRVRDPSDDCNGFIVLPGGFRQFQQQMVGLLETNNSKGHHSELRQAFVRVNGEVGVGRFNTEEELERAMNRFILDFHCP